jgi:hypothetical protein
MINKSDFHSLPQGTSFEEKPSSITAGLKDELGGKSILKRHSKSSNNPPYEVQINRYFREKTLAAIGSQQRALPASLSTDRYQAAAVGKATVATIVGASAYCVVLIRRCRSAPPKP